MLQNNGWESAANLADAEPIDYDFTNDWQDTQGNEWRGTRKLDSSTRAYVAQNVIELEFSDPQYELITTQQPFPAFVGGFGSGKTEGLVMRTFVQKVAYPSCNFAYYMPTFDLVRTIAFPRFEEKLDQWKIRHKLNKTFASLELANAGEIIFRTMDSPKRIIGFEVADSAADELDTLKLADARAVWNKIIARNRQKKPDGKRNTIAVGTTPEGFQFVYEQWKKNQDVTSKQGYQLIKASTYSNLRNLPPDYIDNLRAIYPSNLVDAYIEGEFVNLKGGTVYFEFNRKLNNSIATILPNDLLHIGMDFNVTNMSAIVHVLRGGDPHAVEELTKLFDTPAMIEAIKNRWPNHRQIYIYPDASGNNRKSSNASETDIALLRAAGFNVMVNPTNPRVKDRVLALNVAISGGGRRRYKVNTERCPMLTDSLEKQIWDDKGEPDKKSGFDHTNDATGYFICYAFPVKRPNMQPVQLAGT